MPSPSSWAYAIRIDRSVQLDRVAYNKKPDPLLLHRAVSLLD